MRVPWTARRSNQSILKEISPACSDAGRDWGQEEKGMTEDEMARWHHRLDGHELSELWELVMDREAWHATIHEVAKSWT